MRQKSIVVSKILTEDVVASIIAVGVAITVGGHAPPSRRGTSSTPPREGDAYADYILRSVSVLLGGNRYHRSVSSGEK